MNLVLAGSAVGEGDEEEEEVHYSQERPMRTNVS